MKRAYNTHLQKLTGVDLSIDALEIVSLLEQSRGSKTILRVRQNGRRSDIIGSGPDLGVTLGDHGINVEETFDAEILTRDPQSTAADVTGVYQDRSDRDALHWNGPRGTGDAISAASFRHVPMFFRNNGSPVDLIDLYRGRSVFITLNGKSFGTAERALLQNRAGVMTFSMNNGGHSFRSDFWTCVDDPSRFTRSIWEDGEMMKFVPMAHFEKRIWDVKADKPSQERVRDFPNVVGYRRNEAFNADQWLVEDTINWGNHTKRGGGRSVMLVALRIAFLLGFRRVYLVGCDFEMSADKRYWFPEQRTKGAISNNMTSYRILTGFFESLLPILEKAGLEVFNCNLESKLRVFPFADLEEAVTESVVEAEESGTEGMYVKRKR